MVIMTLAGNLTAQEWEPLIKNDSLDNFEQRGGDATYEVEDGVLIGDPQITSQRELSSGTDCRTVHSW